MTKLGKDLTTSLKQAAAHAGGRKVRGLRTRAVTVADGKPTTKSFRELVRSHTKSDKAFAEALLREDIDAALAKETRPRLRKRLRAVKAFLAGRSFAQAARSARAAESSVRGWVRIARQKGRAGLLSDGTRERHRKSVPLRHIEKARVDIRAALKKNASYRARKRLAALDALMDGATRSEAAVKAGTAASTVGKWVAKSRRGQALVRAHKDTQKHVRLDMSGDDLRALAATQSDWRFAKRLRVVASVADGTSVPRAAIRARVQESSVQDWLRRFLSDGVEGLRMPVAHEHPLRLDGRQVEALRAMIQETPSITYVRLAAIVAERFGVRYTDMGIKRLVTQSMGFRREGKKLIQG